MQIENTNITVIRGVEVFHNDTDHCHVMTSPFAIARSLHFIYIDISVGDNLKSAVPRRYYGLFMCR